MIELKFSKDLNVLLKEVVSSITTSNQQFISEMEYRIDRINKLSSEISSLEHALLLGNYLITSEELYNDDISFFYENKEYTVNQLYDLVEKRLVTFVDKRLSTKDHYHDYILDGVKSKIHHDNYSYLFCPKKFNEAMDNYNVKGTCTIEVPVFLLNKFKDKDMNEFRRFLSIDKRHFNK